MKAILLLAGVFLLLSVGLAAPIPEYFPLVHSTAQVPDGSSGRPLDTSHHHKYTDLDGNEHHVKHSMDSNGQVTKEHSINGQAIHKPLSAAEHTDRYTDHDFTIHETHHSIQNDQLHSHHTQSRLDGFKSHKHFIDGELQEEHLSGSSAIGFATHSKYHVGGKVSHEQLLGTKFDQYGRTHTFQHTITDGGSTRRTEHAIDGVPHKTTFTTGHGGPNELTTVQHAPSLGHRIDHFTR